MGYITRRKASVYTNLRQEIESDERAEVRLRTVSPFARGKPSEAGWRVELEVPDYRIYPRQGDIEQLVRALAYVADLDVEVSIR